MRVNRVLWLIYGALLAVLLPHTAWAFGRFEVTGAGWMGIRWGMLVAWFAAAAFELAIAALTHKLSEHITNTSSRRKHAWRYRYVNAFSAGLIFCMVISGVANWSHAVEFGQAFTAYSIWPGFGILFPIGFGAVLPLISLLFARILANVNEIEQEENEALMRVRVELTETKRVLKSAEQRALIAEQRFGAAGDLLVKLLDGSKQEKIMAAARLFPQLPQRSIALIADTSPAYVSQTLKEQD